MKKELLPQDLCFGLFVDAIKRHDKNQFAYFSLYYNIAHCDDNLKLEKSEGEDLAL
jgi:hypothetical protein